MPALDSWLSSGNITIMSASARAAQEWQRIQDRPSSVVVTRVGVQLAAQTVRIEADNTARWRDGALVDRGIQTVTVFGIRGHATLPDTNIQRSDLITFSDGTVYEVIAINTPPGEVQALCEASRGS